MVEHGSQSGELEPVVGFSELHDGDKIRVQHNGIALLSFADFWRIRVWSNSALSEIVMDWAPGTSYEARAFLEEGGFTGEANGSQLNYTTPNNARITILGTQFFVAYDPVTAVTTAGNFGGTVLAEGLGSAGLVPAGMYVAIRQGAPPDPPLPLPPRLDTLEEFERRADERGLILAVVDELAPLPPPPPLPPPTSAPTTRPPSTQTPPALRLISVAPQSPHIYPAGCQVGGPVAVDVVFSVSGGVGEVRPQVDWRIGESTGTAPIRERDDLGFEASIGPVSEPGDLTIVVSAVDAAGGRAELAPIVVQVVPCSQPRLELVSVLPESREIYVQDCTPEQPAIVTVRFTASGGLRQSQLRVRWSIGEDGDQSPIEEVLPGTFEATIGSFMQDGTLTVEITAEEGERVVATVPTISVQVKQCPPRPARFTLVSVTPPDRVIYPRGCAGDVPTDVRVLFGVSGRISLENMAVSWVLGESSGQGSVSRTDSSAFAASVGPFEGTGVLTVNVTGVDNAGNEVRLEPVVVQIVPCPPPPAPTLALIAVTPEDKQIGTTSPYCGDTPRVVSVTFSADGDLSAEQIQVSWQMGDSSGEAPVTQTATSTFETSIGPFGNGGTLTIRITAVDAAGNRAELDPLEVTVFHCPG